MRVSQSASQGEHPPSSLVAVIAFVVVLAGEALACQHDQSNSAASAVVSIQVSSPPGPTPSSASVLIQDFEFSPYAITVTSGTTVTWTNVGSAQHTVTRFSEGGIQVAGPNSVVLNQRDSYSYTYRAVGFFPYHCSIHPSMHGIIEVTQ
jgi:plastocyanin